MKIAEDLGVTVSFAGSFEHSALLEKMDDFGYSGERAQVSDCRHITRDLTHLLTADGRFQYCVWQTSAVYNWRKTGNVDPLKDPRASAVREMIMHGVIPLECGGAGCPWVGRRPATEESAGKEPDGEEEVVGMVGKKSKQGNEKESQEAP